PKSPWSGLYPWIDEHGETLTLPRVVAPEPDAIATTAAELAAASAGLAADRAARARPTYHVHTATGLAKRATAGDEELAAPAAGGVEAPDLEYRGLGWGTAVHGALDAAARGAAGERLRAVCRGLLLDAERPLDGGEPVEL